MPEKELVVLLGAGASYPDMCTVNDLTRFLLNWSERREPLLAPGDVSPAINTLPSGPEDCRPPLFTALKDFIAPTFKDPNGLDFEKLIHLCEQLATLFPLPQEPCVDRFRSLVAPFLAPSPAALHFNIPHLIFAAQDACYAILDHVSEYCDRVSTADHPQARGLSHLANRATLRTFSLNYDDLPYCADVSFYDGWKDGRFSPTYPWPRDTHTLCQLHGSVLWGHHESEPFELHKFDTRKEARAHRNMRGGPHHFMDNQEGSDAPMITGLRKADRIMFHPYGTYFHVYRDELLRSPNWLIVGYGFRDPHVNQALAQARSHWRARGAAQRILVADKYAFRATDEDGCERVRHRVGASEVLERILGPVFRDELWQFHGQKAPYVKRGAVNKITDELAVWLDGAETAFTTNVADICSWIGV